MTVDSKRQSVLPDQRAGLDLLPPFASTGGDFELADLKAAARALHRLPDEPCTTAALRAALADPPGIHAVSRVEPRELAQWAAIDLLGGDLIALIPPSVSGPSGGTKAKRATTQEEFVPYQPAESPKRATGWIAIELIDDEGVPYPDEFYRLELPDGSTRQGRLDREGKARIESIPEGSCKVFFPDLDDTKSSGAAAGAPAAGSSASTSPSAAAAPAVAAEAPEAAEDAAASGDPSREHEATPACWLEFALPVLPSLDGGEEYPPAAATVTLRSSGGYERALKVSDATPQGELCCFRFDDIPEERHDDDFSATLAWDGGESTLFEGAKVGHFMAPSDETGPLAPVFASVATTPQTDAEESASDETPEGGEDEAPNGLELPSRFLTHLFEG
jgi:hypothetical protein